MTVLDGKQSVWQTVRQVSQLPDQTIRNVMGALGLPARFYPQLVSALSGGELVKLQLIRILVGQYNVDAALLVTHADECFGADTRLSELRVQLAVPVVLGRPCV
ncbi:hypothetical protein WP50_18640 [Lactiplantibacillus plantarum]|nr:hypothetical protein WP50_18640 [Lactiplantibacillus plantarum]